MSKNIATDRRTSLHSRSFFHEQLRWGWNLLLSIIAVAVALLLSAGFIEHFYGHEKLDFLPLALLPVLPLLFVIWRDGPDRFAADDPCQQQIAILLMKSAAQDEELREGLLSNKDESASTALLRLAARHRWNSRERRARIKHALRLVKLTSSRKAYIKVKRQAGILSSFNPGGF
jgi:hypothetical protein